MAYKSKAMQKWAGENQPSPAGNYEYKSAAMRNYEANMAKKAQQEEAERQQALLAQQEAEAPRRATLKDLTLGSIGKGYATSRYGNERYDEIMLGTQRQANQAQKAKEKLEQEKYNFEAKSKAGQAISGAGELIGQIAYNLTNKDTLGAVVANVAGASAVGAVVPLPEELVTIPVAVGRGLKMGSVATSFQVSAAQAYDEMLEAGVSPKTAKTVANVIGGGVAALDAMQVDELAKGFKLAKNAKTEAGEKAAANIAKALAKVGKSTAIETGQEVAQEAVTMVGQDVAKRQEGIKTFSGEEYKQRLGDTAVQSALSFGLLGGAGAVGGAVMNRNNVKTQANEANRADNEADNVEESRKLSNNVEAKEKPLALPQYATKPTLYADKDGLKTSLNERETEIFTEAFPDNREIENSEMVNKVLYAANKANKDPVVVAESNFKAAEADVQPYLEQTIAEYEAFTGEGVAVNSETNQRMSNNPQWYRDYYAKHKKAPSKAEKKAIGEKMFWEDVAKGGGNYVPPEIAQRYNAFKGLAEQIKGLPLDTMFVGDNTAITSREGLKPVYSPTQSKQVVVDTRKFAVEKRYGQQGKDSLTRLNNATESRLAEFDRYYRAGTANQQRPADSNILSKNEATAAFMAGMADAKANKEAYANKKVAINKKAGLDMSSATHLTLRERITWDRFAKALGLRISFADTLGDVNAKYNMATGEIVISRKADNFDIVVVHEIVHRLRQTSPNEFYELAQSVLELLESQGKLEGAIAEYGELYGLTEGSIEYFDTMEEIVADFMADEVSTEDLINMVNAKPSVAEKLLKIIEDVIKNLAGLNDAELKQTKAKLQDLHDKMKKAVNASENAVKATEQKVKAKASDKQKASDNQETKTERFSLKNPVEQTKDLIAVHNLNEEKLASALKLGGLPSPSIAIVKAKDGHETFGDITMVFDKATIDPKNKKNKVYGSDAWTPTKPEINYEVNTENARNFDNYIWDLSQSVLDGVFKRSSAIGSRINSDSTSNNYEELVEKIMGDEAVKAAYIAEKGINIKPEYKTKQYHRYGNEALDYIKEKLGEQKVAEYSVKVLTNDFTEKDESEIRQLLLDYWLKDNPSEKYVKAWTFRANKLSKVNIEDLVLATQSFIDDDGGAKSDEIDKRATLDKIDESIRANKADYESWLREKTQGVIGEAGIYNGKDPYTASGNKKSFWQLHNVVTLENLVKAMNSEADRGVGMFGGGAKALQATATTKYSSIAEIKADRNRLKKLSTEEHETILEDLDKRIDDVVKDIQVYNNDESYMADSIINDVLVAAAQTNKTPAAISKTFKNESNYTVSNEIAKKIANIYNDVAQIPVSYFEAKPQRAVGFDEVEAVIIPSSTSEETKQKIKEVGMPVVEYDGTEQDRLAKLNSLENVRFSKKTDAEYLELAQNPKANKAKLQKMVDEAAKNAGYTVKAYHGTPNGTFTVFKDWQYFTEDPNYADVYQNQGASSNRYKTTANAPRTYSVYLKTDKAFDTRNPKEEKIFNNEFYRKWGNGAPLSQKGLPDWTDADDLVEFFDENGYDYDTIYIDEGGTGGYGDDVKDRGVSIVIKDSTQIKSADPVTYDNNGNVVPLSKRFNENESDIRWSKKREPDIPDGYKERGFNESVRTKSDYDAIIQQEFIDNPEIFKQLANKVTKEKAKAIMDKGLAFAETEFPKLLERMDATAIALGDMMAREYSKMDQHDKAVTVIRDMAKQLTKAGQFSQAAVIALTKSNPMTALAYAKRDIDKLNADGHKQFGKKWKDFEITAEEEQMFKSIKQGDADAIKAAYEKINKRIAREYPSTIWQKFIEASRISMLLNPRTNVKNVVSNLLLYPVTRGSGILSSKLQKVYAYYNKDYKPNQSGLLKKEIRKQAEGVWDKVKDTFDTTSKYNEGIKANKRDIVVFKEGMGTRVMENIAPGTLHKLNTLMNTDDAGLMETLRHATYWLLEYGDNIFVKQNFISRLGSYMQAKGITDINAMSEEDMAAAIEVAYREALRATFKDDTALSKWMASIKHTGNPYIDAMMEIIMPFTKTPANIAMRGIDYSPIGLINTITKAKKGADASEVIDELSKNLLGSALIAIGALLFSKGIVTGGEPENEKEAAFLKQQGWQPYAVKVGDGYATYDWAQPAAIPIIMGVTIMESLEEGRLGVVDAVKNAGVASFNQWVELSPLQSLKEVMGGYGTVGENLLNTAIEMPQRLIPSALGATARTADTTQRLTYSKGNVAQTQKDLAKSKVPGLSQTLPAAYDTWGREKKRDDGTGLAAFNQFINPSSYKGTNATEADREINRLYNELGDSAIYPRKASYSIEKGGKTYTLSNAEYSEYQRIMGQLSYDGVKALMAKPAYNELTDHEKAEIIKDIYDNAFEKAKYTIMEGQGYKKTEEDIRTAKETKIKQAYLQATPENIAEYYIAYYILNNADSDKTASGTTISGSKKKNGINRLVELGYSRTEARRLYDRLKG